MKQFLNYLNESPTSFQAVSNIEKILIENDYEKLEEGSSYKVVKGGKYYVKRNGSSILAFNVGKKLKNPGMMICASHSDCPSFKVKPQAVIEGKVGSQLNVETYGGPLLSPWFDRPLSLAGRVLVEDGSVKTVGFVDKDPICIIPSVAPHLDREANSGKKLNPQIDLLPLVSLDKFDINDYLSSKLKVKKNQILGFDLYLYPTIKAYTWGYKKEFVSAFHIDNLECAYFSLMGFVNNFNDDNINVYACFDNEEVGSLTRQGADSDFFKTNIERISQSLNIDYYALKANSMILSCDNAHGMHPNHPELSDPVNHSQLNNGVVIKFNANQSYTSDGLSSSLFKKLLSDNKIPFQVYTNRSDQRGGSTLGNLSNRHTSLLSVDIGLSQLAMHSPLETCGSKDAECLKNACEVFYKSHLVINEKEEYQLA